MPPAAPTATNSGQAQQNLQAYTGGMQSPDQAIQAANAQYGTQAKQQTANDLQTSLQNTNQVLNQVAPGVMGRTANSLVTSAQANRQIQNESAPIQTQLNNLGQQYQTADKSYTDALGQAENQANANLGFQNQHQSYLQGIYNDLYTQEQNAAQLAAEKYAADASVRAAGASVAAPSLGDLGMSGVGGMGGGTGMTPFAKGTNPQDAIKQLFQGYQVGNPAMQGHAEAIMPIVQQLLAANNPKTSAADIQKAASDLIYGYRKATFGE